MNSPDLHDLMLAYVAGCADAEECRHVEVWLSSGDITAHAAYAEALAVMHTMPLSIDPVAPPPELRKRLMKRCNCKAPMSLRWPLYGMTAIAACLAVALTLSASRHGADASRWQDVQRVMASRDVTFATMKIQPTASSATGSNGAYGRVLYCPVTKMYEVHVFELAPPPPGRVYELWLITSEKKPLPAGTFTVKANGSGMILSQLPQGTSVIMAAITDEPEGGSQTPTGKMQLTGDLAG